MILGLEVVPQMLASTTSVEQAFGDNFWSRIITIKIPMKHSTQYVTYFYFRNLLK